jgi:cAMP phosphodiesterase
MGKLFSKKKLCLLFGTNQRISLYTLRKHFFTDVILRELDISKAEYAKIKTFNFEQTQKIKTIFADDLKNSL